MKKILKIIVVIIILVLCISSVYIYKGYSMYKEALQVASISEKVANIKSNENYETIDALPQIYLNAVIATEDHRFYEHNGIDIIAINRAIIHDIKNGNLNEGGSTITQQLAKNIYFTQEKKLERKIAEIFMAFKIEKELDKDQILELYLNTSYFGRGFYNIKEASLGYFGKEPTFMDAYESTLLAGIPNAPSIYGENDSLAKERQNQVLDQMIKYKYLTNEEKNSILASHTIEE